MARVSALALVVCALALAQTASAQEEWKRYIWIGPPTNSSFDLLMDVAEDESEVILLDNAKGSTNDPVKGSLKVPTNSDPKRPSETYGSTQGKLKFNLHFFQFKKLTAGEVHHIYAKKKDKKEIIYAGSVWTLPAGVGEYFPMKIALGSCQVRSRDAQALQEISMWNKAVKKEDEAFFMLVRGLYYTSSANLIRLF